jgi:RNA polymerase sigma-70 factor (ECF subfamily)
LRDGGEYLVIRAWRVGKANTMTVELHSSPGAAGGDLTALIPYMRTFARSLCRDAAQADDLTQDALASAWRHRGAYTPGTNLKAWVSKILRNQFYSDRRRSWRVCQLDADTAEETLVAVSDPYFALELDDVRRAMLELPDEQREALTLIGISGMAYEEAAEVCGCAAGTIKSRVSRGRQRLSSILADGGLSARTRIPGGVMTSMLADAEALRPRRAGPAHVALAAYARPSEHACHAASLT